MFLLVVVVLLFLRWCRWYSVVVAFVCTMIRQPDATDECESELHNTIDYEIMMTSRVDSWSERFIVVTSRVMNWIIFGYIHMCVWKWEFQDKGDLNCSEYDFHFLFHFANLHEKTSLSLSLLRAVECACRTPTIIIPLNTERAQSQEHLEEIQKQQRKVQRDSEEHPPSSRAQSQCQPTRKLFFCALIDPKISPIVVYI